MVGETSVKALLMNIGTKSYELLIILTADTFIQTPRGVWEKGFSLF